MLTVKSLSDTRELIQNKFSGYMSDTEKVNIADAVNRVLAEDIVSKEDTPHFVRSTLDGYAINAKDTFGASESIPAIFELIGEIKVNSKDNFRVQSGQTVYVPTGGCIPNDTNAVAMIEIAEKLGNEIFISKSVAPGTGIIFKGDDIKSGETAIYAPEVIAINHIGTFAALGYSTICVKKKLKCGIISTGDELISIDSPIDENKAYIRDVNSHLIKTQAEAFGCEAVFYGIFKDRREQICDAVEKAYHECDIILVSGGSSAGIMDLTKEAFINAAGAEILVHGIAVKPGKPTIIAKAGSKALIGLPGHPVSAFFIMQEIVQYVICSMYGVRKKIRPVIKARLSEKAASNNGRDEFIPVRLQEINGKVSAIPINYKSGLITLLSKSDGYIWIPRFAEGFDEGTQVEVYVF
jgi:molybdopterin molybdotransferase